MDNNFSGPIEEAHLDWNQAHFQDQMSPLILVNHCTVSSYRLTSPIQQRSVTRNPAAAENNYYFLSFFDYQSVLFWWWLDVTSGTSVYCWCTFHLFLSERRVFCAHTATRNAALQRFIADDNNDTVTHWIQLDLKIQCVTVCVQLLSRRNDSSTMTQANHVY